MVSAWQAYFQKEDLEKSMSSMKTAISLAEEEGYKPKENWYVIVAACIGELKKKLAKKKSLLQQLDIYEILVNLYTQRNYISSTRRDLWSARKRKRLYDHS